MKNSDDRYQRSMMLFGREGQRLLRSTCVALVGVGGLGSAFAQHLALLGVRRVILIDHEELDETNRNRFVGARHDDPIPGWSKVDLSGRLIREINPDVEVLTIFNTLFSIEAFDAIKGADVVVGCFDEDGPRAALNELCAAFEKPYFDLASDVPEAGVYGGRVCIAWDGGGCLSCAGLLDREDIERYCMSSETKKVRDRIYGIEQGALERTGPSVSPVNGVVASLAAAEFMVAITGMRRSEFILNYYGQFGKVTTQKSPTADCHICKGVRGLKDKADVDRYLRMDRKEHK